MVGALTQRSRQLARIIRASVGSVDRHPPECRATEAESCSVLMHPGCGGDDSDPHRPTRQALFFAHIADSEALQRTHSRRAVFIAMHERCLDIFLNVLNWRSCLSSNNDHTCLARLVASQHLFEHLVYSFAGTRDAPSGARCSHSARAVGPPRASCHCRSRSSP